MYDKKDKRRLYWLIEQYLSAKIDESTFCDEYYYSYDLEIDDENLSEIERRAFSDLSKVCSRFSQHEEDHKLDSHAFFTSQDLRKRIIETQIKLEIHHRR